MEIKKLEEKRICPGECRRIFYIVLVVSHLRSKETRDVDVYELLHVEEWNEF